MKTTNKLLLFSIEPNNITPLSTWVHQKSAFQSLGEDLGKKRRKSEEMSGKKGEAIFTPAGAHLPENIGTGPIDVILVELKKPSAK